MLDDLKTQATPPLTSQTMTLTGVKYWALPISLALICLLTFAYTARTHTFGTYATETDFYHFYAPDAEKIAAGQFPENTYQAPGYPLIILLVSKITGDLFVAGKWVSIISAALIVLLTFQLMARLFGYWVGIGAALIVMVSGQLPQFAIQATTDVFFLMLCLAALSVFTSEQIAAHWRVIFTAVITGLAYLTRYNGLFLLAACIFGIVVLDLFNRRLRQRITLAAIFVAVFLITASPWLYFNYKHRGSPFYNTNYLNMATFFYSELAGGRINQDGTRELSNVFHSFGEMLSYDPKRIIARYPGNLYDCLDKSINRDLVSPWVGWLAVVGAVLALIERRSKAILLLLAAGAIFFLLMALNHWETRYYFFITPIYAGLAVYAVCRPLELLQARGWLNARAFALIPAALVLMMWWTSFNFARQDVARFLATQQTEIISASDYLKSQQVSGARILSRKPNIPYLARQEWVFFPRMKSLNELRAWLKAHPVDYITYGSAELSARRELAALKDPQAAPPWLKPVWTSQNPAFVLYKPALDAE